MTAAVAEWAYCQFRFRKPASLSTCTVNHVFSIGIDSENLLPAGSQLPQDPVGQDEPPVKSKVAGASNAVVVPDGSIDEST